MADIRCGAVVAATAAGSLPPPFFVDQPHNIKRNDGQHDGAHHHIAQLLHKNSIISITSFLDIQIATSAKSIALFIRPHQHVDEEGKYRNRRNDADDIDLSGEE